MMAKTRKKKFQKNIFPALLECLISYAYMLCYSEIVKNRLNLADLSHENPFVRQFTPNFLRL